MRRPAARTLALALCACGHADAPPGGPWRKQWLQPYDPAGPVLRGSLGNISRPLWNPAEPAALDIAGAPGACAEFECESGAGPVELVLTAGGARSVLPAVRLPDDAGPWHAYRVDLAAAAPGAASWQLSIGGAPPACRVSMPRIYQQRDAERPNLLCIVLDTVRADVLGCYGHDRPTSPRLDAFAAQAALFEHALSPASWTLPALASWLTGRSSEGHGVIHTEHRLPGAAVTLFEVLGAAGYTTGACVAGTFTDSYWGFDQGFDHYDDLGMVVDDAGVPAAAATDIGAMAEHAHRRVTSPEVTDRAIAWLRRHRDRRFALWAHYFDPHEDYVEHAGFSRRFPPRPAPHPSLGRPDPDPERTARLRARYEGEVAFTDHHVGRLLDALAELELEASTVVVVLADHGEEFFDRYFLGHGNSLYNELVRVPLLVRGPGVVPARHQGPVGLVDLEATLRELCRAPGAAGGAGRSLVPLLTGQGSGAAGPVFASLYRALAPRPGQRGELVARRVDFAGLTLILDGRIPGSPLLYDRSADPRQARDVATSRPADALRLRRLLEQASANPGETAAPERVELDAGIQRALAELGYLDAPEPEDDP